MQVKALATFTNPLSMGLNTTTVDINEHGTIDSSILSNIASSVTLGGEKQSMYLEKKTNTDLAPLGFQFQSSFQKVKQEEN